MKSKYTRKRLWVDPGLQFRLLLRTAVYLVGCVFVVLTLSFLLEFRLQVGQPGPPKPFLDSYLEFLERHKFLLTGLILLLPFILFDLLKFSHRIAGPLYRCRHMMEEMGQGKRVAPFVPRKNDLLRDLFVAFNRLVGRWNTMVGDKPTGDRDHANGKPTSRETPAQQDRGTATLTPSSS